MTQSLLPGSVLDVYKRQGQESTQVTPIQLANYIATLVNGGTRYSTHLLKTVKSNDFSQVTYNLSLIHISCLTNVSWLCVPCKKGG